MRNAGVNAKYRERNAEALNGMQGVECGIQEVEC